MSTLTAEESVYYFSKVKRLVHYLITGGGTNSVLDQKNIRAGQKFIGLVILVMKSIINTFSHFCLIWKRFLIAPFLKLIKSLS